MKEKEAIAVGFFSDLESSWAATKIFREVVVDLVDVVVVNMAATNSSECSSLMCSLSLLTSLLFTG